MKYPTKIQKRGFTLVETIVTIAIFSILAIGVNALFTHIFSGSRDRLNSIDQIDQSRLAITKFLNEIRVASLGADGSYPIGLANDSEIIFYSRYGQNSDAVAKIRYFVATSTLYKSLTTPTENPATYPASNEKIYTVQKNLASSTAKIFYYYDGDYDGSTAPLSQPVNVNDIKFVRIELNILKMDSRNATTTFQVGAGASIRNLKNNLGN